MSFSATLQRFMDLSPIPVMVKVLLERVLSPENIDAIFDKASENQYCRKLLFSSLFDLMGLVVTKNFPTINAAYVAQKIDIGVSITSVYNKLNGLELAVSSSLVRDTSTSMRTIIDDIGGRNKPLLPGYVVKMLDGNCIEATEHRLSVLRDQSAGALPGKSLVIYEPELEMATHVFPCEDGHAQERSLLSDVLQTVNKNDLIISDRNFCVRTFLGGIHKKNGYYICRHHKQVPYQEVSGLKFSGKSDTGRVFEQWVEIDDGEGNAVRIRRIVVKLKSQTRDGDSEIVLLTNLPKCVASAVIVAKLYRERWSIETMFQRLESHLHSEINTLGYPKAALFGFCMAVVAYNVMAVVKASLRKVHGEEKVRQEISGYYIAGEIARTREGMEIAVFDEEWIIFQDISDKEFSDLLIKLANKVQLEKYKKNKRGPKKPPLPKKSNKSPHVSTHRLLINDQISP